MTPRLFTPPSGDPERDNLPFDYSDGVKFITWHGKEVLVVNEGGKLRVKVGRPDRAREYFERFLLFKYGIKAKANQELNRFEKDGFTATEAAGLRTEFTMWWPQRKRKKGKQGRRRSMYDERVQVRDENGTCWVAPPPKPLTLTAKDKAKLHESAVEHGWQEKLSGDFAKRKPIKRPLEERGWGEPKGRKAPAANNGGFD
jgi:hypothetical protein